MRRARRPVERTATTSRRPRPAVNDRTPTAAPAISRRRRSTAGTGGSAVPVDPEEPAEGVGGRSVTTDDPASPASAARSNSGAATGVEGTATTSSGASRVDTGAMKRNPRRGTVWMYRLACASSPRARRSAETIWLRLFSSTTRPGHSTAISVSLSSSSPACSTKYSSASNSLGVSGTSAPSRRRRRFCAVSMTKSPKRCCCIEPVSRSREGGTTASRAAAFPRAGNRINPAGVDRSIDDCSGAIAPPSRFFSVIHDVAKDRGPTSSGGLPSTPGVLSRTLCVRGAE